MNGHASRLKVFKLVEDQCVYHWVAAADAGVARAVVVGQMMEQDCVEECSERPWTCEEISIEKARETKICNCEPRIINMWEACLDATGAEYLACSEW